MKTEAEEFEDEEFKEEMKASEDRDEGESIIACDVEKVKTEPGHF